jgi:hypothetical protein
LEREGLLPQGLDVGGAGAPFEAGVGLGRGCEEGVGGGVGGAEGDGLEVLFEERFWRFAGL